MNREQKLRGALEGTGMEHLAGPWSRRPATEVDELVRALKASRRAGAAEDREKRRQRRRDRRNGTWTEDEKIIGAVEQMVTRSLAPRAALNLETLARLKQHYEDGPAVLALAVAGARAQGYSDSEIARALGVTRQAVEGRFGRRHPTTPAAS